MKNINKYGMLALVVITISLNTANASICKELSHSTCNKLDECRWIDKYERSDGRSVKAYCRKSNSRKPKATTTKDIPNKKDTSNQGQYRYYDDK